MCFDHDKAEVDPFGRPFNPRNRILSAHVKSIFTHDESRLRYLLYYLSTLTEPPHASNGLSTKVLLFDGITRTVLYGDYSILPSKRKGAVIAKLKTIREAFKRKQRKAEETSGDDDSDDDSETDEETDEEEEEDQKPEEKKSKKRKKSDDAPTSSKKKKSKSSGSGSSKGKASGSKKGKGSGSKKGKGSGGTKQEVTKFSGVNVKPISTEFTKTLIQIAPLVPLVSLTPLPVSITKPKPKPVEEIAIGLFSEEVADLNVTDIYGAVPLYMDLPIIG